MTHLAEEEIRTIYTALDRCLVAKVIWEVKKIPLRKDLSFWVREEESSSNFLEEVLTSAFGLEVEVQDENEFEQYIFSFPPWKRIALLYSDLIDQEKSRVDSLLKYHVSFEDSWGTEGRIFFGFDGKVSININYSYISCCNVIIDELLDLEMDLLVFEKDVQKRLQSKGKLEELV